MQLAKEIIEALNIINNAQQSLWELSHKARKLDDELGHELWMLSLQIESALLHINESNGKEGYWENE